MTRTFSREDLTGATFYASDLTGATFTACDIRSVRITASEVEDLVIEPHAGELGRVVVDGIDVTGYVTDQLDARFPERVHQREAHSLEDYRALWAELEAAWAGTITRAAALTAEQQQAGVGGQWSFSQTLRHLVFGIDIWLGRMINGQEQPWHPHGQPCAYPADRITPDFGIDPDAEVSFDEAVQMLAGRHEQVRAFLADATDDSLEEVVVGIPAPHWGQFEKTARGCLQIICHEHVEHRRYAERDLALL